MLKVIAVTGGNGNSAQTFARILRPDDAFCDYDIRFLYGSEADLSGVEFLYIVQSIAQDRVEVFKQHVDAAIRAEVKFTVAVTVLNASNAAEWNEWARSYFEMDEYFIHSGIHGCIIAVPPSMELLLAFAEPMRSQDMLAAPLGSGRMAPLSIIDLSKVVCWIFQNHERLLGTKKLEVTGPEELSGNDIAAYASKVFNRKIVYYPMDQHETTMFFKHKGVNDPKTLRALLDIFKLIESNVFDVRKSRMIDTLPDKPLGIYEFFLHHHDAFLQMQTDSTQDGILDLIRDLELQIECLWDTLQRLKQEIFE
ncbi:hypothetical protein MP638_000476 [Amoeboaphelidium occidentale]|nr:hypothetical protein MP638_000476 [Amoeboaphelidium occidentale]